MKDKNIRKNWKDFTEKYKQYFLSNNEEWFNSLKLVEDYIIKNSKRPSSTDKDIEIKQLGSWIHNQQIKYKKNTEIMKDEIIKKAWIEFTTKYKEYFLSNNELWFNSLKEVEDYIIKNNKRPSNSDIDVEIKRLAKWIGHQQENYSNNEYSMKDDTIKKAWYDFTTKYKQYFLSNNEIWFNNLKQVEEYIIKNSKRPSTHDKDVEIKQLGSWLSNQQKNYSNNEQIMENDTIRKSWVEFTTKYKQYFLSNNELWFDSLKEVEDYIIKNNKRPSTRDKDIEIKKIGLWTSNQQSNYSNNEHIMKDETCRAKWFEFTTKYQEYFLTNNEVWLNSLKQVEDYIIKNSKRPSTHDKDIKVKQLGSWINTQQSNYSKNTNIMKDESMINLWFNFTTKYKQYFLSNNEIWLNNLKQVENYIIKNNKRPSNSDIDVEIKRLAKWISHQQENYSKNKKSMKDETIRKAWIDFTKKYPKLF